MIKKKKNIESQEVGWVVTIKQKKKKGIKKR